MGSESGKLSERPEYEPGYQLYTLIESAAFFYGFLLPPPLNIRKLQKPP
jgi:hypothetical protein